MKALLPLAQTIAARLIARKETIAIAESSTGGLIAAALLAARRVGLLHRRSGGLYEDVAPRFARH